MSPTRGGIGGVNTGAERRRRRNYAEDAEKYQKRLGFELGLNAPPFVIPAQE